MDAKRYLRPDTGEIVEVLPGLGDVWIVGTRKPNGSIKRLKSPQFPPFRSRALLQRKLDKWVLDNGGKWITVEEKEMAKAAVALKQDEPTFDYLANAIEKPEAKSLEKHAKVICETIDQVRKTTAESVIKLGEHLWEAHEVLCNYGDGTWGKWCKLRCGISRMQAQRVIDAYDQFGDCNTMLQTAEPTALYLLSSPSCPEEATDEAIKAAERGEPITTKRAREIIKSHQVEDDDDEPAPTRRTATKPQESDDDQAICPHPPRCVHDDNWSLADFLTAIHQMVDMWRDRCPTDQLEEMAQVLRDMANQIDFSA